MRVRASLSEGRRGRLRAAESVAGWVFADMLLVLFLVGLGTAIPVEPPEPEPEIIEPEVIEPEIVGMETKPISLTVSVPADRLLAGEKAAANQVRKTLRAAMRKPMGGDSKAALVLIFGGGETAAVGQRVASAVRPQLNAARKDVFPKSAPSRNFWDGSLAYGTVRLEVFLFTTEAAGDQ